MLFPASVSIASKPQPHEFTIVSLGNFWRGQFAVVGERINQSVPAFCVEYARDIIPIPGRIYESQIQKSSAIRNRRPRSRFHAGVESQTSKLHLKVIPLAWAALGREKVSRENAGQTI